MTDKPITFSAPMVRAYQAGIKTQTRRILAPHDTSYDDAVKKVRLAIGDRLWVREAWQALAEFDHLSPRDIPKDSDIIWLADRDGFQWDSRYRHARFMPRWASRYTLEVTDVRIQRLQDIDWEDAEHEGAGYCEQCGGCGWVSYGPYVGDNCHCVSGGSYEEEFAKIWNSIHGPGAWEANPWVAAISFPKFDGKNHNELPEVK